MFYNIRIRPHGRERFEIICHMRIENESFSLDAHRMMYTVWCAAHG